MNHDDRPLTADRGRQLLVLIGALIAWFDWFYWLNQKIQMSKFKVHMEKSLENWKKRTLREGEFGKGALSANLNFFDIHSWATGGLGNPVLGLRWLNARIVEKICLSSEERLFRRSRVISVSGGEFRQQPLDI